MKHGTLENFDREIQVRQKEKLVLSNRWDRNSELRRPKKTEKKMKEKRKFVDSEIENCMFIVLELVRII